LRSEFSPHGLFVGLTTLDCIYRADHPPLANQKLVASDCSVTAGGPATNAAVAFAHLGGQATVVSVTGCHPMTHLIRADLEQCKVAIADLDPHRTDPPPISSIIVTEATGERAVISINAVKRQATPEHLAAAISDAVMLENTAIVLIDGHQIEAGRAIAQQAKTRNIPVVLDGGSWKPGLETILPFVDYAICSANFYPPGCIHEVDVLESLTSLGIPQIAITHGEKPIYYQSAQQTDWIGVPAVRAIDTLGAGDIFHGAFCYYILQSNFVEALTQAAEVASRSCQFFGTRQWMEAEGRGQRAER
jgi:sugar/nucleoside kinase (ribokinase family)